MSATLLLVGGLGKEILTRVAAGVIIVFMIIAILMALPNGFNAVNQGWEAQLLALVIGVCFLVRGNNWFGSYPVTTDGRV